MSTEIDIEKLKMERLLKNLDQAAGEGTSLITLFIAAGGNITKAKQKLICEESTAAQIKLRFNRQSVQSALRSLIARLGIIRTLPNNGLALFCGCVVDEEGKDKKIVTAIEPFLPLPSGLYKCDSKFHTEGLHEQLSDQQTYGFVIIDGSMTSFHTIHGNNRQTIFKIGVSLPPKHGRGGQSKNRFERIREEKRGWYISKVTALAVQHFINPSTSLPNVQGIVLGGSAHLKEQFLEKLDPRLSKIVVAVVDTQYGGESGFYEAVQLTQDQLSNISFVHEQKLLGNFFEVISQNGLYCLGVEDTMYALTSGLLETLILWKNFPHVRSEVISVMNPDTKKVLFVDPSLKQPEESVEWNVVNSGPLLDWILEHYKEFGAEVVFVSDQTSSGSQFVKGFGGIGGLLRFEVSLPSMTSEEVEEDFEYVW